MTLCRQDKFLPRTIGSNQKLTGDTDGKATIEENQAVNLLLGQPKKLVPILTILPFLTLEGQVINRIVSVNESIMDSHRPVLQILFPY